MQKSRFLKWVLAAGIVVVMNLLFGYGVRTFYRSGPKYNDYCPAVYQTPVAPVSVGGKFANPANTSTKADYQSCNRDFQAAQALYNRNVFVILIALGILAVSASFLALPYEAVSLGLSLGGVLSLIVGTVRYWSDMDDYLRFGVLLAGFVALLWLGIKKIRD